jgi:hypothetical protein
MCIKSRIDDGFQQSLIPQASDSIGSDASSNLDSAPECTGKEGFSCVSCFMRFFVIDSQAEKAMETFAVAAAAAAVVVVVQLLQTKPIKYS